MAGAHEIQNNNQDHQNLNESHDNILKPIKIKPQKKEEPADIKEFLEDTIEISRDQSIAQDTKKKGSRVPKCMSDLMKRQSTPKSKKVLTL